MSYSRLSLVILGLISLSLFLSLSLALSFCVCPENDSSIFDWNCKYFPFGSYLLGWYLIKTQIGLQFPLLTLLLLLLFWCVCTLIGMFREIEKCVHERSTKMKQIWMMFNLFDFISFCWRSIKWFSTICLFNSRLFNFKFFNMKICYSNEARSIIKLFDGTECQSKKKRTADKIVDSYSGWQLYRVQLVAKQCHWMKLHRPNKRQPLLCVCVCVFWA